MWTEGESLWISCGVREKGEYLGEGGFGSYIMHTLVCMTILRLSSCLGVLPLVLHLVCTSLAEYRQKDRDATLIFRPICAFHFSQTGIQSVSWGINH